MYFLFIVKSAIDDFRRNKVRTVLTSLGILIGVASVVLLQAFGLGLKRFIQQQFESLGTNLIYVVPGNISEGGFGGGPAQSNVRFDLRDVARVKRVNHVALAVPTFEKTTKVQGDRDSGTYQILASTHEIYEVTNLEIDYGRKFERADVEKSNKVVILGPSAAEHLFGEKKAAIGRRITAAQQEFKVIGVAKPKGGGNLGVASLDNQLYIPYTAGTSFNPDKKFIALYIKIDDAANIPAAKTNVKAALANKYKDDEFSVVEQTEILNTINSIFAIMNTVLVAIAGISLIVGGVGIMNIMYVSVIERIREIGIRRALGARKQDILYLFLAESIALSLIGGIIGLLLSFGVVLAIQTIFPAYIDAQSVAIALGVSSVIGISFGVFPAKKAADLSPIDAIRYE